MTDAEIIEALEERIGQVQAMEKELALRELAFVIHKFCNGRIDYTVEDIQALYNNLDLSRVCIDGKITYTTRMRRRRERRD